jgi:hypothetical protein
LQEVLDDIDARNPGLKDRIVESEALRRFVNVYVNDEDVRLPAASMLPLRMATSSSFCRRRRRLIGYRMVRYASLGESVGHTPLVGLPRTVPERISAAVGKARGLQPHGSIKDRAVLQMIKVAEADGTLRPGATILEPRAAIPASHLRWRPSGRLSADLRDAGEHLSRTQTDARAWGAEIVSSPPLAVPMRPFASPSNSLPSIPTG